MAFVVKVWRVWTGRLNLMISVVVDFYQETKKNVGAGETLFVTESQKAWQDALKIRSLHQGLGYRKHEVMAEFAALAKESSRIKRLRYDLLNVVLDHRFEYTILALIAVDTVAMLSLHVNQDHSWTTFQLTVEYITTAAFVMEVCLAVIFPIPMS